MPWNTWRWRIIPIWMIELQRASSDSIIGRSKRRIKNFLMPDCYERVSLCMEKIELKARNECKAIKKRETLESRENEQKMCSIKMGVWKNKWFCIRLLNWISRFSCKSFILVMGFVSICSTLVVLLTFSFSFFQFLIHWRKKRDFEFVWKEYCDEWSWPFVTNQWNHQWCLAH